MLVPENVRIRKVERAGAIDRYGEPDYSVIYKNIGACLERSQFMTRALDGDTKVADGTIMADAQYTLRAGDLLTLETDLPERYLVYRAQECLDAMGTPQVRVFILTKLEDQV